jgi:hypothetical protein
MILRDFVYADKKAKYNPTASPYYNIVQPASKQKNE